MRELVSGSFLKGTSDTVVACKVVFHKACESVSFFYSLQVIRSRIFFFLLPGSAGRAASGPVPAGQPLMDVKGPKKKPQVAFRKL